MFKEELDKAIRADPLTHLDKSQRELIWKFRTHCSTVPEALPKLLRCVNWANLEDVSVCVHACMCLGLTRIHRFSLYEGMRSPSSAQDVASNHNGRCSRVARLPFC